jgi:hypothetical protein
MVRRLTRRELLFREAPKIAKATTAGWMALGLAKAALAEPHRKDTIRSDRFAQDLLLKFGDRFFEYEGHGYLDFCERHGFRFTDRRLRDTYMATAFFYELMREGGILGNRYFTIEARFEKVMRLHKGKAFPLDDESLTRLPSVMLRDMFSAKPRYRLRSGQSIHCFGDCDEYEMAYSTVLKYIGIPSRVVMSHASHVRTMVRMKGKQILIDNTRKRFALERGCEEGCEDYMTGPKGYRSRRKAKAYIEKVNERALMETVVELEPEGIARVERLVDTAFRRLEERWNSLDAGAGERQLEPEKGER